MTGLLSKWLSDYRLKMIRPYLIGQILDIGCGKTSLALDSYTGIDREYGDLDDTPLEFPQQYDTIILLAVIEHIYNQKFLMQGIVKHLSDGGHLVMTTPTPFGNDVIHPIGARLGLFSSDSKHEHIVIYNKRRLEMLARKFNLEIVKYKKFQLGCNQLAIFRKHGGSKTQ